jgi:peptidoglycan-N-acetylglucosamine deacetylase
MRARFLIPLAVVAVLAVAGVPGRAAGGLVAPFALRGASLTQTGQQLTWTLVLGHAFSAAGLKRDGRSLCLAIERRGGPSRTLCVAPGRHGIALRYGQSHAVLTIAATISRSGPDQMTATFLPSAIGESYTSVRWQTLSGVGTTTIAFPRRPALAKLHTPRLVGCVPSGPNWVFSGPSNVHAIALTFDDGPWLLTPEILSVLEREHVPATFFQIGEWIGPYGEQGAIERRMLADGDMIGDHTWTHPDMLTISPAGQRSQLELTSNAIRQATGFTPCLWRAPYGDVNPALLTLARSLGFVTMQWDIDPRDWALPGVAEIDNNIVENAHNGAIVEEHDGGGPRQETLAALPEVIATLRARGYTFETLTQMLGYKLLYQ